LWRSQVRNRHSAAGNPRIRHASWYARDVLQPGLQENQTATAQRLTSASKETPAGY
jgi:hypothetical protein